MSYVALAYGVIHAIIDASSITVAFAAPALHGLTPADGYALVVVYDLVAFGSQCVVGLCTDRLRAPRGALLAGIGLTWVGVAVLPVEPVTAVALAGLGNALFHVGASVFALSVAPGRAAAPGLFVAPGALGVGLGVWAGHGGFAIGWPFHVALAASLVVAHTLRNPELCYAAPAPEPPPRIALRGLAVVLLLASVGVRSFVGMAGCHECPQSTLIVVGIPFAAFAGKALGGFAADRLGWVLTGAGALALSAPLIAFGGAQPQLMLAGFGLMQATMPVTLVAIVGVMPRRPGLAFGLTCLALILGALPTFGAGARDFYGPLLFLGLLLGGSAAAWGGLRVVGGGPLGVRPPGHACSPMRESR